MTDFRKWSAALLAVVAMLFAANLRAQIAPTLPAGLIYQAAAQGGIDYVNPISGQAIINQKAALNWKSIAASALSDGSIGILTAGLSGVIKMGTSIELGLAAGHAYYDHEIGPLIAGAAPNPNDIPPVLQVTGSVSPSVGACTENSMYAAKSPPTVFATINGLSVTFASQGQQVLRHIDGTKLKQFQVVDVLVCQPGTITEPIPAAPLPTPSIRKTTAWISSDELLALALPE